MARDGHPAHPRASLRPRSTPADAAAYVPSRAPGSPARTTRRQRAERTKARRHRPIPSVRGEIWNLDWPWRCSAGPSGTPPAAVHEARPDHSSRRRCGAAPKRARGRQPVRPTKYSPRPTAPNARGRRDIPTPTRPTPTRLTAQSRSQLLQIPTEAPRRQPTRARKAAVVRLLGLRGQIAPRPFRNLLNTEELQQGDRHKRRGGDSNPR
jgi:hypothetical protein